MSVFSGSASDGSERKWVHRHWGVHLAVGTVTASPFVTHFLVDESVVGRTINVATTTAVLGAFYLTFRHSAGPLCEKCFEELPANASELANGKRRPFLETYHKALGSNFKAIVFFAIYFTLIFVKSILTDMNTLPYLAFDMFMSLMMAGALVFTRVHSQYLPWCPWCKNDGDGDDITTSDPDPSEKLPA